ncbi:hypothetical protein LPW11_00205 [Geomonas sp. RF6]|uniref:hypothetical protein n=1 Tax=Geomonas sp. RF6 TaxID=2897342 RepID=UPI001E54CFA5|nr:hypothetical protein [Geomonas sp. RF6]UFS70630.1 hypothetical protein LPW11_00205 [Geomonas sp. RF6]
MEETGHAPGCGCAAHAADASVSLVGSTGQVVFDVREKSSMIRYLGETAVTMKGGAFSAGKVQAVAVLWQVGRYVSREYVTWWDYQQPGYPERFEAMSRADYVTFNFYGDIGRIERTFITSNPLKGFFARAIREISEAAPWSADDFASARLQIMSGLLAAQRSLWDAADGADG